ncbi:MAG: Peptidoglycan glycosyltransferase [Parcubacteria group bacterium GW2011_GWC2_42_6]|nr:MAG: Peptidoglycan glycosyltransferase [Parcubacteria group bacterium GW2011_GWC2_42_6]
MLIRIFFLCVYQHEALASRARNQQELDQEIPPKRGIIYIQEKGGLFNPLATNREYQKIFLVPKEVVNKEEAAQQLADILKIDREEILIKLQDSDSQYKPIKSKVDNETSQAVKNLKIKGVYFEKEQWRWYPQDNLASHVLGFVGIKDYQKQGLYGLEGYYDTELAGVSGQLKSQKDALGRWLLLGDYDLAPAQDGADIYLTLDQNVQYTAEQKLKDVVEKWGAIGGSVIVMEPKTGAIRAMASLPDFNPNEYNKIENIDNFLNPCVQKLYEPGSIFKPITMAAALDSGKATPETSYTDTGSVTLNGYTITNAQNKSYGLSTMTNVLEKSINTGVVYAEHLMGPDIFKKYIEAFGFYKRTDIDLMGEIVSNLSGLKDSREINFATAAFGQGIAVTPLQIATAISAIANDGKLMRPYIVEKIVDQDGREDLIGPQVVAQVIRPQSAGQLTAMLVSTVRNGYDKIKMDDYFVAGKTGTAQIPNEDKRGYNPDDTIHSFVGYAPAYDPKFLIFLKVDKPHGINFASESLAPVFADLTRYLLNYYEIPPEQ